MKKNAFVEPALDTILLSADVITTSAPDGDESEKNYNNEPGHNTSFWQS